MMQYRFRDWHDQQGTVPVTWNSSDYEQHTVWYQPKMSGGFSTSPDNEIIYGTNIAVMVPRAVLPVFSNVTGYFDLKNIVCDLSKYTPGMILPWHTDNYPTYSRNMNIADKNLIVRIIVFLHDPMPGHQLWIKDHLCSGKAGSWFSWVGDTKHMAANLGESDRYVIQITGHV